MFIDVTQKEIDKGYDNLLAHLAGKSTTHRSSSCPIALALWREFPNAVSIDVRSRDTKIYFNDAQPIYFRNSDRMKNFIHSADYPETARGVKPTRFNVEVI